MGLFDSIKRAMGGGGGVGVKLAAPKSFTWDDQQLPLVITLQGHKDEARTIVRIEFELRDLPDQQTSGANSDPADRQSGTIVNYLWDYNAPIDLGPKAEHTVQVSMPLPFTSAAATCIIEPDAMGGMLGKVLGSVKMGPPTSVRNYQLTAKAHLVDIKGTANASQNLRYGGAFKSQTTIGGFTF